MIAAALLLSLGQEFVAPFDLAGRMEFAADERNGYLDYLQGASVFTGSVANRELAEFDRDVVDGRSVSHREARSWLISKYGKAWESVGVGNRKSVLVPGADRYSETQRFYDLAPTQGLRRLGVAIAVSQFESGDAAGGWNTLIDGWVMGNQISGAGQNMHFLSGDLVKTAMLKEMAFADPLIPKLAAERLVSVCRDGLGKRGALEVLARGDRVRFMQLSAVKEADWVEMKKEVEARGGKFDIEAVKGEMPELLRILEGGSEFYQGLAKEPESEWLSAVEERDAELSDFILSELIFLPIKGYVEMERDSRTFIRLMMAQAQVSLFYWNHGRFPTSLAEADFVGVDPFSGKEFGYRLQGKRFDICAAIDGVEVRLGDVRPRRLGSGAGVSPPISFLR